MRKAISLAIPVAALIVLGATFLALEARRTPDWQVELDEYIESHLSPPGTARLRLATRASKPWNFGADMGKAVVDKRPWNSVKLPFPPKEVMCVLLERDLYSANDVRREAMHQVVFVSYYTDSLWNHGWVVHEGARAPFSEAFQDRVSSIGCDLKLERFNIPDSRRRHTYASNP